MKKLLLTAIIASAVCVPSLTSTTAIACEKAACIVTGAQTTEKVSIQEPKGIDETETLSEMRTFPFSFIN